MLCTHSEYEHANPEEIQELWVQDIVHRCTDCPDPLDDPVLHATIPHVLREDVSSKLPSLDGKLKTKCHRGHGDAMLWRGKQGPNRYYSLQ